MNAATAQKNDHASGHTDLPVGEILRRTRVHFGQSIEDVGDFLRIRSSQIEAIETGDIDKLPGRAYAIGYVRTYSEYLGLDGEKMVQLFKQQSVGKHHKPELHFPVAASESKAPNMFVIFGSLVVLVMVLGGWMVVGATNRGGEVPDTNTIPKVPAEMKAATSSIPPAPGQIGAPAPVMSAAPAGAVQYSSASTAVTASPAIAQPGVAATAVAPVMAAPGLAPAATPSQTAVQSAPQTASPAQTPVAATPVAAPAAAPGPSATAMVPTSQALANQPKTAPPATSGQISDEPPAAARPAGASGHEIKMTVLEKTWVEVRDKRGNPILSRILKPGEVFIVPEENYGLRLDTGNAGGLDIMVDGQSMPPLGKQGDILRGFVLDGNQIIQRSSAANYNR